ncbi:MAG: hypothetical protein QOE90_131 [Thermoplasmata archaeon]|nr:hypothetical protein [Thermoplasmata archaeon]
MPVDEGADPLAALASPAGLDALFGALAEGVTVQSPAGIVYANAAAEPFTRAEAFDESGAPLPPGALAEGVRRDRLLRFHVRATGEDRWALVRSSPLGTRAPLALNLFQDVTEARRAAQRQEAQNALARVLAEALPPAEVVPRLLAALGESLGWDAGALWLPEDAGLVCTATWRAPGADAQAFVDATQGARLAKGEGLPGRVLASRAPEWIPDSAADARDAAGGAGPRGAVAFPLRISGRVAGVIELLARDLRAPDAALVRVLDAIGAQVGLFVERAAAEDARHDAAARAGAVVDAALDAIVTLDEAGRILAWNPAAQRTFGWTREEALGREMADLIVPPELREPHRQGLQRYVATGNAKVAGQRLEMPAVRRDGERFPAELAILRLPGEGAPTFTGFVRDLSAQKRAQANEQLQRALLEAQMESVLDAILVVGLDGRILSWNKRFTEVWGIPEDVIALRDVEACRGYALSRVRSRDAFLAGTRYYEGDLSGATLRDEVELADGTILDRYGAPVRLADGALVGRIWCYRDVTPLRRTIKELDQFAYVTSHDLKAPLRGIANLSRWIEEDMGEHVTDGVREHLELLRGRVSRMESLIDAILQYSRVGRVRGKLEDVDTGRLVAELVDLLDPPPGFVVEVAPDMPVVRAERLRLHQVLLNLIGNAIKHHHRKSEGRVRVRAKDEGWRWRFEVEDDGPGIAARYHERVFVIFQTLEARDKVEGTGIGLALVKKIVEAAGGQVSLASEEGRGATFSFTWPKGERP